MSDRSHRLPDFARDPYAWFDHVRQELVDQRWREIAASVEPSAWTGREGHPWRIVRSPRGIEVRPDLTNPFLRHGDGPRVTALSIGEEVEVELTTSSRRWVDRFPPDAFDVGSLGRAMLDEEELPHDNLRRLFPTRP